ncbi:hypothetical protein C8R46DRAFT_1094487 [Mycena filopes]|nr:hypothetical protein C8R46DRAFT_1094487 [Mycena filopes]
MPPHPRPDLKQVTELFNTTIAAMRDEAPGADALEAQAIAWLKEARYKLMRELEKRFYALEATRDDPSSWPVWAMDPTEPLVLVCDPIPGVFRPYAAAMHANLLALLKNDCGFEHCESLPLTGVNAFTIYFPDQVGALPPASRGPREFVVQDQFLRPGDGQARIDAASFAELIMDVRGEETEAPSRSQK